MLKYLNRGFFYFNLFKFKKANVSTNYFISKIIKFNNCGYKQKKISSWFNGFYMVSSLK